MTTYGYDPMAREAIDPEQFRREREGNWTESAEGHYDEVAQAQARTQEALAIVREVRALCSSRGYVSASNRVELIRAHIDREMIARGFEFEASDDPAVNAQRAAAAVNDRAHLGLAAP